MRSKQQEPTLDELLAIAQHVVFNYEVGTRNYGRFLLGLEPLPAIY